MLKVQEIRELIKLLDQSSLDELEYEHDDCKLKLKKNTVKQVQHQPIHETVAQQYTPVTEPQKPEVKQEQPTEVVQAANEQQSSIQHHTNNNLHQIESPMVGTFYSAPSPDQEDYVKVGDKVKKDSIVCIVEAMKLFNEIEAEVNGEIVEILVENGQLVEYGQPLFLVKAE